MRSLLRKEGGFTIVELVISMIVLLVVTGGFLTLFVALVNSAAVAKRRAVASALATNQMEYLKSLPYDDLAVAGGSIFTTSPLPATKTETVNNVVYTTYTSINYVDDAFDGCATPPASVPIDLYCRNYPPPSGAPDPDQNPQDYKIVHVRVTDGSVDRLAEVDTQISSRVAETASLTGALFVQIIDDSGTPVSGATANVVNTTQTPDVNLSDTTDSNGVAIFYGLPPDDPDFDYQITASKSGYSSLMTILPNGSLQPTYPNQNILIQQSSYVTLTIKQQATNSLVLETVNTDGSPLSGAKIYAKGGYKKYTDSDNAEYYYDNFTPSDNRPTTDGNGLAALSDLVPGSYIFCGDQAASNCTKGGTTYYLAAAVPYSGTNPLNPINVLSSDQASPSFDYSGVNYIQKVRLMLTPFSGFPRLKTIEPSEASVSGGSIDNFAFNISGQNLPCDASPGSCATDVSIIQGSNTFPASCVGAPAGTDLSCEVDLSAAAVGSTQLKVETNGYSLTLPASPLIGGIVVAS